jgi:hypothetical protein
MIGVSGWTNVVSRGAVAKRRYDGQAAISGQCELLRKRDFFERLIGNLVHPCRIDKISLASAIGNWRPRPLKAFADRLGPELPGAGVKGEPPDRLLHSVGVQQYFVAT